MMDTTNHLVRCSCRPFSKWYMEVQAKSGSPHAKYTPTALVAKFSPSKLYTPQTDMGYYTSYYSYGLPTFIIIVIALYLLFTGMYPLWLGARV